jgi:uncharacterized protein
LTKFIPIFPLQLTVYPGEALHLHIFEPRYIQLINECFNEKKVFGIPTVINNEIAEFGCTVEITEITEVLEHGKMNIKTKGVDVFQILEKIGNLPNKLFGGAIVTYPINQLTVSSKNRIPDLLVEMRKLHQHIGANKNLKKPDEELNSYDIAHHVGMQLNEEYELLQLMQELQRQEYLRRHLKKVNSVINEMELLKEKIKLNGHFKFIKGL